MINKILFINIMNNFFWIIALIFLVIILSSNKENFENITVYPGPYDYNTKIVSICRGKYQPCNLYRY